MRDSAALKTLKQYYNDRLAPIDPTLLQNEILGTSDRAAVIILAAFLDDALQFLLTKKMRPLNDEEFKKTFSSSSPLGPFSARIDMSYLLGGIDEDLRDRLHDLREMRNACAHSKRPISFENSELANVCKRFMKSATFKLKGESQQDMKDSLISECFFLFNVIISSRKEALSRLKEAYEKHKSEPPP